MRKFNLNRNKPLQVSMYVLSILGISIESISQTYSIDTLMRNGERHKRINLVYLSDGYKNAELPTFILNATGLQTALFSQAPFAQYKNYFNSYAVKVPSVESGAEHPRQADDEPGSPAYPESHPVTNFGSTFDFNRIHRLLVPKNASAVHNTLANNFPDYSQAFILVNSPIYGGSGAVYPTTSADIDAAEIAIHEMGHTFALLADEYWAGDIYAGEKHNMTTTSNPATVKWKNWVGTNGIGVYPYGSSGTESNWFRPHQNCKMRTLGVPFCSVCIESFINEIHERVNMIDAITPTSSSLTLSNTNPVSFSVTTLQTNPSTVDIKWYLNNSPTPLAIGQTSVTVPYVSFQNGSNTLRAEVIDNTPLSKSYLPGVGYLNIQTWTIEKSASALPVHLKSFTGKITDQAALLTWEIDSPDDLQIFELEKSKDGLSFTRTASISGEQFKKNYQFTDTRLFAPYTYYRLKTIEKSGLSYYSSIIRLQNAFDKFYYKVYQDADNRRYHLSIGITNQEKVAFSITDLNGRVMMKKDFGKVEKQLEYDFDLRGKSPGIYYMTLFINNSNYTVSLLAK